MRQRITDFLPGADDERVNVFEAPKPSPSPPPAKEPPADKLIALFRWCPSCTARIVKGQRTCGRRCCR